MNEKIYCLVDTEYHNYYEGTKTDIALAIGGLLLMDNKLSYQIKGYEPVKESISFGSEHSEAEKFNESVNYIFNKIRATPRYNLYVKASWRD